jgi:hypothetical protein
LKRGGSTWLVLFVLALGSVAAAPKLECGSTDGGRCRCAPAIEERAPVSRSTEGAVRPCHATSKEIAASPCHGAARQENPSSGCCSMQSAPRNPVVPSAVSVTEPPARSDSLVAPALALDGVPPVETAKQSGDELPRRARAAAVSLPVLHCSFLC